MATTTLSNAIATDPASDQLQNGLGGHVEVPLTNGVRGGLRGPQISVQEFDEEMIEEHVESPGPRLSAHSDETHLKVIAARGKFHSSKSSSLPLGAQLERFPRGQSPSVDSSACNSSDLSDNELNQEISRAVRGGRRIKKLDADLYGDISSGVSSDDESVLNTPLFDTSVDHDDEVFHEFGDIDICNEADSKLVDWSFNVFVPACRALLLRCAEGEDIETTSGEILANLRSLSNTINFFCSEQQRLSGQIKFNVRGISSSLSTDRFSRIRDLGKNVETLQSSSSNKSSVISDSSSGFSQDSQYDRSFAVKILRSVSQSLIQPLLLDCESGFTPDIYKSIVQAIQKIAWKVEACLSFNDPTRDFNIYDKIFDEEQTSKVAEMLIRALPPEEPKLQSSAGIISRSGSMSTNAKKASKDENLLDSVSTGHVIRRTPSNRVRPGGGVFDSVPLTSEDKDSSFEEMEGNRHPSSAESSDRLDSGSFGHNLPSSRRRIATYTSPQRVSKVLKSFDKDSSKTDESIDTVRGSPHYFRPSHHRRTTISLSRREVTKLGLTTAKRVDDSIVASNQVSVEGGGNWGHGQGSGHVEDGVEVQMGEVKNRLCDILCQQFEKDVSKRNRSASTSDLLDDVPEKDQKATAKPVQPAKQPSIESQDLNEQLRKSYMPATIKRQTSDSRVRPQPKEVDGEFVFVANPGASLDSTTFKDNKRNSKVLLEKGAKKARKAVTSSLLAPGKFTNKVLKTAAALRRGSLSASSKGKKQLTTSVVSTSMDQLLEEPLSGPRSESSRSEPPSPLPKADTMPSKRGHSKGTLSRLGRPKSSKSMSGTNSLSRRRKNSSPKSGGFLTETQPISDAGNAALTESIYRLSNKAIQPVQMDSEDQLLISSVEYSSKLPSKSHKKQKRASLISSSSTMWYELTVITNMKQFGGRAHYTILRTVKQIVTLYDVIVSSHPEAVTYLPGRPEKKASLKTQKQQVEDFLRYVARVPELRATDPFVLFLMPDDEFGNFTDHSAISFELLMTFYTPDMYPGPPGSHNELQVVSPEDVPNLPSPGQSRRPSNVHQKRGTLHMVKKEGKEENSTFVIREEGQDALIVACEDERYMVVAGTFEKLVEQLACEEKPDPRFVMTFLLGYRHFASTMDLLSLLLRRFHMSVAPDATEEELSYAEKWRYVIQLRVLDIITFWLKKCWPDFYRNSSVLDKVKEFIEQLKASQDTNFQLAGTNLEKVLLDKLANSAHYTDPSIKPPSSSNSFPSTPTTPNSPRPLVLDGAPPGSRGNSSPLPTSSELTVTSTSVELSPRTPRSPRATCLDISTVSAIQLARQLTLIELEALRTIDIHELVVYTWEQNSEGNKPYRRNIDEYISRFNKLSFWISSEICSVRDAKTRGSLIEKFIDVAKHCQEYKNFNSTISIMSGLSLTAVKRLKKSWECVSEKMKKSFDKMSHIMSPANNHIAYRKLLATVNRRDPCIPYFGVFIRDLTFFNDGNHKTLKNGLLNFSKLRTMVYKFEELKRYQRSKYFFPPEDKIQEFCRNLWCLSESDLYEASYEMEPRDVPLPPPEETDV